MSYLWPKSLDYVELNSVSTASRERILTKLADEIYSLEKVPACLCGSNRKQDICYFDRSKLPVGMVICLRCGLVRTTPRLAETALPNFYEYDYHPLIFGKEAYDEMDFVLSDQGHLIYDFCKHELSDSAKLKVLEIGAAGGRVLTGFGERALADGFEVNLFGTEYSTSLVRSAEERGINMSCGGVECLTKFNECFDVVILSHVLEHMNQPRNALVKIRHLMHERSILYIEVPGIRALHWGRWKNYREDLIKYFTIAHAWHFCLETLVNVVEPCGFKSIKGSEMVQCLLKKSSLPNNTHRDSSANEEVAIETVAYLRRLYRNGRVKNLKKMVPLRLRKIYWTILDSMRNKSQ